MFEANYVICFDCDALVPGLMPHDHHSIVDASVRLDVAQGIPSFAALGARCTRPAVAQTDSDSPRA